MGRKNLVSIIMPTYNCAKYIEESIQSVLAQTIDTWELFVIDDASTDDTRLRVKPFLTDARIHYICLPQNMGPAEARNQGLQQAHGAYIAFLDSDDLWAPEKLERQLAFMEQTNDGACYFSCTAYTWMDEAGSSLHTKITPYAEVGYWKAFFLSNPIGNSTVLYDRSHFPNLSVPHIKKRNDFALWLQMLKNGEKCYGLTEPLTNYRVRSNSISSKKLSLAKYHWQLYRHIERLSLGVSILGMLSWAVVKGTGLGVKKEKYYEEK